MNMHSSRCHFSHCLFVVFQLYQRQCRALCNGPQKSQVCHEDIPSSNLQMQLPKALAVTHVPLVLHQWHPCQRKSGQLPLHVLFQLTWRSPLTHSFLSTHFLWCCVDGWGIAAAKVYPHQLQSFHGSIGGKQSVDQQTTWYATLVCISDCMCWCLYCTSGWQVFSQAKSLWNAAHVSTSHTISTKQLRVNTSKHTSS